MAGLVRCAARFTLVNKESLLKLTYKETLSTQQNANISSKAWRELNGIQRPPPYDYKNKTYNLAHSWFDKTTKRFDDNTKVNMFYIHKYQQIFLILYKLFYYSDNFGGRPYCCRKN